MRHQQFDTIHLERIFANDRAARALGDHDDEDDDDDDAPHSSRDVVMSADLPSFLRRQHAFLHSAQAKVKAEAGDRCAND